MARKVAIIGDRFMRPAVFARALRERVDEEFAIATRELPWPDEPMCHGYAGDGLDGLREFIGRPEDVLDLVADAEILIDHLAPVNDWLLARCPGLKLIGVARGGPVNIDMRAARERGVAVVNAPGRNAAAVAEFTIGTILAETRLVTKGHAALSQGVWRGDLYRADRTGEELSALTVGVIGYGHVGRRVVGLLKAFGCRILVDDPFVTISEPDRRDGVEQLELGALLDRSDVVTLHARVTAEATCLFAAAQFAAMKAGSYFVNTARGPLVDYGALHEALRTGHIRGAALDTFWHEPPPADSPLLHHANVTLTPHIAGASLRTVEIAAGMVADEIGRYVRGEPFAHPSEPRRKPP